MGSGTDGVFDRVYLGPDAPAFELRHKEAHLPELYRQFPEEKATIDEFMVMSDSALMCVKLIVASKLLPLAWQPYFWRCVPDKYTVYSRATAKELLQARTSNNRLIAILCGLWVDTGARPDRASFMMTAACFRGLPLEGGCYPSGGAEEMPKHLIPIIEKHGGRVLVRARVGSIDVERRERKMLRGAQAPPILSVMGVTLSNGTKIKAPMVISGAGYLNTVTRLLSKDDAAAAGMPLKLPSGVKQSSGFVMVNVGIKGNAAALGIDNANVWYHPVQGSCNRGQMDDNDMNIFPPLDNLFRQPDPTKQPKGGPAFDFPCMITFPSVKDAQWDDDADRACKTTCQILVLAEWAWFSKHEGEPHGGRSEEYETLKKAWGDQCLEKLFRFYPKTKEAVVHCDVSTPLSIAHYLNSPQGGAVGLGEWQRSSSALYPRVVWVACLRGSPFLKSHLPFLFVSRDFSCSVHGLGGSETPRHYNSHPKSLPNRARLRAVRCCHGPALRGYHRDADLGTNSIFQDGHAEHLFPAGLMSFVPYCKPKKSTTLSTLLIRSTVQFKTIILSCPRFIRYIYNTPIQTKLK